MLLRKENTTENSIHKEILLIHSFKKDERTWPDSKQNSGLYSVNFKLDIPQR